MTKKRDDKGRFIKGKRYSPETEFKKGEHWRPRKPYWDKEWLRREYEDNFRSANEIAEQFGITEAAILHWLRKHKIPRRDMTEIRTEKHWGLSGEQNGMYGKRGEEVPSWKGGVTPERQAFYSSMEWKKVRKAVYKRDKYRCQRCGTKDKILHVHHIVTFANRELRADVDNLVLLCIDCHHFVHSADNINKEYIGEEV
jgi:hypothetical protein